MLLSEELYQENLEMLDSVKSKKESVSHIWCMGPRDGETVTAENIVYIWCLIKLTPLHFHLFYPENVSKLCEHPKTDCRGRCKARKKERKILSRVMNQNAALEKNKPVSKSLINRYLHISQSQEEKNGESCRKMGNISGKKSHLPVLLMSIPLTFPHTGKYTSSWRSFMDEPYRD